MKLSTRHGWRALAVSGFSAALLCTTAATAEDPIERVVSYYAEGRYSEARAALEPLLKRNPKAPRLRLIHGILRAREGKTAVAIALLESLRDDRPDMFEVYNNLAVLYASQGRLDAARETLVVALERRPDAVAYANLGDVLMRLAERAYARARDLAGGLVPPPGPGNRPASRGLGDSVTPPRAKPGSSTAPAPYSPARRIEGEPLRLVTPAAPASRAPSQRGPSAQSPTLGKCLHAGGFKDRAAAAVAAQWLQARGAELLEIRNEQRRVIDNHRVYLPASPNAGNTAAKVRELRGHDLRDVAIIARGPMAGRISLGLYKSVRNASRRVAQIRKLGYPAKSAANTRVLSDYAVKARVGGDRSALERAWNESFPGNPVRYSECR